METPESTAIRAIRYDAERQRLIVRFIDGDEYAFVGVPGEVHRSFADADVQGPLLRRRGARPLSVQQADLTV